MVPQVCKCCGKPATMTVRLLGVCMVCLKRMADLRQAVAR